MAKTQLQGGAGGLSLASSKLFGSLLGDRTANTLAGEQTKHIKDDKQRELYKQYMLHAQPLAE